MQATDNIAERTNRRCAQLLAIILVVLALIEFFPAIAKYFTAYSVPPVFSLSRSESPQTVAVADSSAISNTGETAPSEYSSDYSGQVAPADESDKRSLLPSSLPEQSGSEQPVEEKVKQDFKETIEQFRKAERQPLREPPAARPEPVSSEESEISSADKIVVTEAAPVPVPVDILIPAPERPVAAGTAIADKLGRSAPEAEQLNQFRDQLHTESDADSATDPEQTLPESARRFLAEIDSLQHPDFQPADGYWANTYIPGDPLMRQLESRLQREPSFHLVRQIRPNRQPFDPPQYSALALYVNADKASVSGPTRLKLQIGLQASLRQSGQRPAMNIGIVLDWRNPVADMAVVRALLMALQQAKQPGDRFSLIITGKSGSVQVSADQFRFGPLQLALSQLSEKTAPQDPPLTLSEAVSTAADQVRQLDDPNAGLGSSLVLLITTDSLNDDLATLESLAHRNAIEGIFLSVINIGQLADSHAVQQLVLLGQGNRRLLTRPDEAPGLIERELYAASRAVARALRLRIHLQPGVQLIDILGSHRLDEPEAQRVREAEQSIDQRLQRNLGIQADRGEDEEGIQIVIPHFYAGDSHVILLDVVAERSGPIAQVSARYKDLVTLDNAVVHAQLTLDDGAHTAGPLQRNVLKNLLAFEFSETTRQAAGQLMAGQQQQAVSGLTALRQLFYGMRQAVPVWSNDRELLRDTQLLSDYLAQLNAPSQNPQPWADALRYVAFRKLIPAEESL